MSVPIRWEFQLSQSAVTKRLAPDGRSLFVVSSEGESSICDARTGEVRVSLPKIIDCSRSISWSRDGHCLALGDLKGGLYVYETSGGKLLWQSQLGFLFARALSLSKDGNLLAVSTFDKQIRVWDLSRSVEPPKILIGNDSIVSDMVFTAKDAKLVSGSVDGTICEWSLATYQRIRQIR